MDNYNTCPLVPVFNAVVINKVESESNRAKIWRKLKKGSFSLTLNHLKSKYKNFWNAPPAELSIFVFPYRIGSAPR